MHVLVVEKLPAVHYAMLSAPFSGVNFRRQKDVFRLVFSSKAPTWLRHESTSESFFLGLFWPFSIASTERKVALPSAHALTVPESIGQLAALVDTAVRTNRQQVGREIGLDSAGYGTHTMRQTKAAPIDRRRRNLRAVRLLLGHTKLERTIRYLGIEVWRLHGGWRDRTAKTLGS